MCSSVHRHQNTAHPSSVGILTLQIINPILFEKQRVEKIGLFKPADSSASSSETELEPPSKKSKN
jgi:hypothetical protein